MLPTFIYLRRSNFVCHLLVVVFVVAVHGSASAALVNTPNLSKVRIWESTGPFTAYDFPYNGITTMLTKLGNALSTSTNDFSGVFDENYDVFYSDAAGNFDPNGDCVTVEAIFPHPLPSGGGLNLGAVDLVFNNNSYVRADIVKSWVGLGDNFIPASVVFAADPADNTPIPTTDTTMGNISASSTQHLRVTVGWRSIPEPGAFALGAMGMLGARLRRKPATKL